MQTFLPYANFSLSAQVLDRQRLGKQRVETLQIMSALVTNKGWIHHPATKMWRGYEWALLKYQEDMVEAWLARGYSDTCLGKTQQLYYMFAGPYSDMDNYPYWLGDREVHISHQSNLVRKDAERYGPLFPGVPDDLPYIWPETKVQKRVFMARLENLVFENAKIMFRNFAGREQTFNSLGDRNFCLFLDDKRAESMRKEGWNVKETKPRDEGDAPQPYVQVAVNYNKGRPPRVVLITSKNRVELGGDEVQMLDYADIKNVDVVLNPYEWEMNGKTGVKAYLKTAYFTLNEDELELKYAEDPTNQSASLTASDA